MSTELAVVKSDTDETNGEYQRQPDGKFACGNKGGPGGPRPGSGRKPKPKDPSLLSQLFDILDESAPRALERLTEFIESPDDKVSLKACIEILKRVLPESKLLPSWEEKDKETAWDPEWLRQLLDWKAQKDIEEAEKRAVDAKEEEA
jgi:hypothetical protein